MISFRPYASSSSGNVYTVTDGETVVMLDCGLPWKKIRETLEFKTAGIAGILITHRHMDHCKGAEGAAKAGLELYASGPTFDALEIPKHRMNIVEAGEPFEIGTWKILPFLAIHDVEGSLGFYMVNRDGEAFLYLTDSAYSPVKFKDLCVIAVECNFVPDILSDNVVSGSVPTSLGHRVRRTHMSLETVKRFLLANDLSRCREIFLLHLSAGNSDEARMIREVQEATGIPCRAADES